MRNLATVEGVGSQIEQGVAAGEEWAAGVVEQEAKLHLDSQTLAKSQKDNRLERHSAAKVANHLDWRNTRAIHCI